MPRPRPVRFSLAVLLGLALLSALLTPALPEVLGGPSLATLERPEAPAATLVVAEPLADATRADGQLRFDGAGFHFLAVPATRWDLPFLSEAPVSNPHAPIATRASERLTRTGWPRAPPPA